MSLYVQTKFQANRCSHAGNVGRGTKKDTFLLRPSYIKEI